MNMPEGLPSITTSQFQHRFSAISLAKRLTSWKKAIFVQQRFWRELDLKKHFEPARAQFHWKYPPRSSYLNYW